MMTDDTVDARTSLIALLVKSLTNKVYLIAEYLKEENAAAARKRRLANKIIIAGEYLGKIIGKSVIQPKSLDIFEELLEDVNVQIVPLKELVEEPITLKELLDKLGYLKVLGVYKGKKFLISPPLNLILNPEDELVLLDQSKMV